LLISAVRSVATYTFVSLYVIAVGPIGIAIALAFGWKGLLYELGHCGVRLGFALSGIHFVTEGVEHIPGDRAVVFCSNHQSNIDPPVLFEALHRRVHILYKQELNAIPILARAFRLGGFISVDRRNREASMRSIDVGAASIRAGNSFLIFPEGTRSKTDDLLPFKKGGFIMAIKGQAPIVPVAIQGGRAAMQRGSWLIRPVQATVKIGRPIDTSGFSLDERDQLIAVVRSAIEGLIRTDSVSYPDRTRASRA
jgi:1-acyl-sn-glycerol-3-phosphate acyltransferase